ncbi:MAG TPA: IPT/TIG domain-containing protein [Thermoanaerobaculia bacterium]|nr:IPT/TIG domain-containing protein [Thermoanaerobaculia bacterium]
MHRFVAGFALLLLFAAPLAAAPTILNLRPPYAWTFGGNHIQILGSDFTPATACPALGCGITVTIGNRVATITAATPTSITVIAPPGSAGPADLKVRVEGVGETIVSNAINYTNLLTMNGEDYDRRLLPVLAREAPGAFAAVWDDELVVRNATSYEFYVPAVYCPPGISPCPSFFAQPHTTSTVRVVQVDQPGPAAFIHVPKPLSDSVFMNYRIRDLSRQSQTWGTELPVVSVERDYRKSVRILDIPGSSPFRAKLRIYGPNVYPVRVHVKVFEENGPPLIDETIDLRGLIAAVVVEIPSGPSYAELDLPTDRASGKRLRAEVSADIPIWAFVAVTNNETQHVTALTPQGGRS